MNEAQTDRRERSLEWVAREFHYKDGKAMAEALRSGPRTSVDRRHTGGYISARPLLPGTSEKPAPNLRNGDPDARMNLRCLLGPANT
jgi:hypothetical protein